MKVINLHYGYENADGETLCSDDELTPFFSNREGLSLDFINETLDELLNGYDFLPGCLDLPAFCFDPHGEYQRHEFHDAELLEVATMPDRDISEFIAQVREALPLMQAINQHLEWVDEASATLRDMVIEHASASLASDPHEALSEVLMASPSWSDAMRPLGLALDYQRDDLVAAAGYGQILLG